MVWERTTTFMKEAEVQATLAEREAWERVSKVEAKSATSVVSTREEADGLTQVVALLEGDLMDVRQS
jgi:hypothetical protein